MKTTARNIGTILCLALLAACSGPPGETGRKIDAITGGHAAAAGERLSATAEQAVAAGRTDEALAHYARLYAQRRHDKAVAVNYARLLRKTGQAEKAVQVLAPFMPKDKTDALVLNEYAAAQITLGRFAAAEDALGRVLEDVKAAAFHGEARNFMGVALDAQGSHREAEQMFRLALDGWKGDPSSVMNNLALSLASQGMFDESLETLRRALVLSPAKEEVARNIQIVSDLRRAVVPGAPVELRGKK